MDPITPLDVDQFKVLYGAFHNRHGWRKEINEIYEKIDGMITFN